jgi:5-formyltetrahydrofolate cyclo-ligase
MYKVDEKKQLRRSMKKQLENLSFPLYEDYSYKIAEKLFKDKNWLEAKSIGITISKPPEVDTLQIIRKAWEQGKQIAIPKCNPETRKLVFRTFTRFSQLEMVYSGLYEPVVSMTEEVNADALDLLIVPGLAFTKSGFRLGFGGGYYDRYLGEHKKQTVSLAFSQQVVAQLPVEPHDLPVSKIITEAEVIECER